MKRHHERELKTIALNMELGLQGRRQVLLLAEEDGCLSKRAYGSWIEAEAIAVRTMDDIPIRRTLLAYRCQFCGLWHVGGDAQRIRNRVMTGHPLGWTDAGWKVLRQYEAAL